MKHLDQSQLIALLPTDPERLPETLRAFDEVIPGEFRRSGELLRWVQEGALQSTDVSLDGQTVLTLLWHRALDGGLIVDVAHTLRAGGDTALMFAAGELLARQHGAPYVTFHTSRSGLARHATERHGYFAEAVKLTKGLN